MKSILEQNFDELYAQVEERVKCIKPVKQLDTFEKTLMWTTLNEILVDVFGRSRFIWMIETNETDFKVIFFDKFKSILTKNLSVEHTTSFVWPTHEQILNMTAKELDDFRLEFSAYGLNSTQVAQHYNKSDGWFRNLLLSKMSGRCLMRLNSKSLKNHIGKTASIYFSSKWTEEELDNRLLVMLIQKYGIPVSHSVVASAIGVSMYEVQKLFSAVSRKRENRVWLTRIDDRKVVVFDKLLHYIDEAIKQLTDSRKHLFSRQKVVILNKSNYHMRKKILIDYFKDKKCEIELEKRNDTNCFKW